MKIGVYFCKCGTNISEKIDAEQVQGKISGLHDDLTFKTVDFMCSEDGKEFLAKDIKENGVERVVISACSPRDHETTFMRVLTQAGINPYLMQMVNVREHIAWVTEDPVAATLKAGKQIGAAIRRICLHEPLERKEIDMSPDVLIIGAGPAGLKAALSIAGAGRKVVLVEKTPVLGGMPVRFEEIFPNMECGPCMLEPMLGDLLHGEYASNIEILTLSEVTEVTGFYGNFNVKVRQRARYVDTQTCIGCAECVGPCPVSSKSEFHSGLGERKAVDFAFAGALPNAPFIDAGACIKLKGGECNACVEACPMGADVFKFDEVDRIHERTAGAILIAIGADLFDCSRIPGLGYGTVPDVYTSMEFERMLSSNGPCGAELKRADGTAPESVAIVHCVGSLDKKYKEYCSGICCEYAFKFNHMIEKKLPGTNIYHFYKELVMPGKEEYALYKHAKENPNSVFVRYRNIDGLSVTGEGKSIAIKNDAGGGKVSVDMVILCPAVVPIEGAGKLGAILEATSDRFGFFEELHGRTDSAQSKIRGVYLAGMCQSPVDIRQAMNQGMAAAGYVLSGLVPGRKLEIQPINATVDPDRCSGCRVCISVCPYKAISFDIEKEVSAVNDVLCQGCGTCVAACPIGAIKGNHFTSEEIMAEIEGALI